MKADVNPNFFLEKHGKARVDASFGTMQGYLNKDEAREEIKGVDHIISLLEEAHEENAMRHLKNDPAYKGYDYIIEKIKLNSQEKVLYKQKKIALNITNLTFYYAFFVRHINTKKLYTYGVTSMFDNNPECA